MNHKDTLQHLRQVASLWPTIQPLDYVGDARWRAIKQGIENTEKLRALEELDRKARKKGRK